MATAPKDSRGNQRLRTRKDLLLAASRLLKAGRKPSMDEIAEEALVSRATAYRYFPNLESLLLEAPLDEDAPDPETLFARASALSPEERVDRAEAALHAMICRNEARLRLMLAHSLNPPQAAPGRPSVPLRQNRRTALIAQALAPARGRLDAAAYKRLCAALALVFGPEAMVVFRDVLRMGESEARKVKSWTVRALVRAALAESRVKS
jgi:AcrR family transcriptional regulator